MIHLVDYQLRKRETLYCSIVKDMISDGFCLSTCPPDRGLLEWLKYEKGLSWQGAISVDIIDSEDLGTIWRIMISSDRPQDLVDRLE